MIHYCMLLEEREVLCELW